MHNIKIAAIVMAIIVVLLLIAFVIFGLIKTNEVEIDLKQQTFKGGTIPNPLPNGYYQGNAFTGLGKNWQGKFFDSTNQTGINKFSDGERYTFKTYPAQGLRDKDTQVLRIDYNQPGNPLWLRFVVDEIVETSPGHYLGKVHLKIIPGIPFTLTYFELTESSK